MLDKSFPWCCYCYWAVVSWPASTCVVWGIHGCLARLTPLLHVPQYLALVSAGAVHRDVTGPNLDFEVDAVRAAVPLNAEEKQEEQHNADVACSRYR
ncbi:hypothetical protein GGR57DRAFT_457685 [Xylariaceae sp. FL1272]|nr:hypothetical protein GGR57DRAFT_457685 [Xylariaceae sp. FL1272]